MPAFLIRSNLSRGDLRIFLTNVDGYPQDAFSVRWTVFAYDGKQISGKSLPATRAAVGEYYAPWFANTPNGNYSIQWEIQPESGGPVQRTLEQFFVVDPASYQCCPGYVCPDAVPEPGGFTYLTGTSLVQGDLPLYLKNGDGVAADAYAVFWTIRDAVGCPITPRIMASRAGIGEYYASWYVDVCSGDYGIVWEWMQDASSPLESKTMRFSVIYPPLPLAPVFPILCDGSYPLVGCLYDTRVRLATRIMTPQCCAEPCAFAYCAPYYPSQCCTGGGAYIPPVSTGSSCCCDDFEIPRTVHLVAQPLPPSGNFTSQPQYHIPSGVRHITFYLVYTRGAPGGYTALRLFWGNGVEETQETMVDHNFLTINSAESAQNLSTLDFYGPIPTTNDPVNFTLELKVPGGVTTVRLLAAEQGVPGAPGTLAITLTAASD